MHSFKRNNRQNLESDQGLPDRYLVVLESDQGLLDSFLVVFESDQGLLDRYLVVLESDQRLLDRFLVVLESDQGLLDSFLVVLESDQGLLDRYLVVLESDASRKKRKKIVDCTNNFHNKLILVGAGGHEVQVPAGGELPVWVAEAATGCQIRRKYASMARGWLRCSCCSRAERSSLSLHTCTSNKESWLSCSRRSTLTSFQGSGYGRSGCWVVVSPMERAPSEWTWPRSALEISPVTEISLMAAVAAGLTAVRAEGVPPMGVPMGGSGAVGLGPRPGRRTSNSGALKVGAPGSPGLPITGLINSGAAVAATSFPWPIFLVKNFGKKNGKKFWWLEKKKFSQ